MVGNIVNASPAADCTPPALAADGLVEIARLRGGDVVKRRVAVKEFVQGPGQVDLAPGEIVSAVDCESLAGYGGSFQKVGHRRSLVISVVCAVAAVRIDRSSRRFEDVRLAIGGIGPVPIRLVEIEKALAGLPVSDDHWTKRMRTSRGLDRITLAARVPSLGFRRIRRKGDSRRDRGL